MEGKNKKLRFFYSIWKVKIKNFTLYINKVKITGERFFNKFFLEFNLLNKKIKKEELLKNFNKVEIHKYLLIELIIFFICHLFLNF